ncbi:MAG: hypothetical protein V3S36_06220, partial [Acidiferrobacterales bacterium]
MLQKAIPGFFSSQSKKRGYCSAPFFKHLRVRKMCAASARRSSRLLKINFQQPASTSLRTTRGGCVNPAVTKMFDWILGKTARTYYAMALVVASGLLVSCAG